MASFQRHFSFDILFLNCLLKILEAQSLNPRCRCQGDPHRGKEQDTIERTKDLIDPGLLPSPQAH